MLVSTPTIKTTVLILTTDSECALFVNKLKLFEIQFVFPFFVYFLLIMGDFNSFDEDTLPDDAWKDSFDKLLEEKAALREMNLLKRDVHASFNLNSSYENSCFDITTALSEKQFKEQHMPTTPSSNVLQFGKSHLHKDKIEKTIDSVSTPSRGDVFKNPFKCALSPIGNWDSPNQKRRENSVESISFDVASSYKNDLHPSLAENVVSLQKKSSNNKLQLGSPLSLVLQNKNVNRALKNVCFDSNIVTRGSRNSPSISSQIMNKGITLQPGKWRKSLNTWRRTQSLPSGNPTKLNGDYESERKVSLTVAAHRKSISCRKHSSSEPTKTNFKRQLLGRCNQSHVLRFESAYSDPYLECCEKIGEGAFGEVFLYKSPTQKEADNVVLKIIPIEGLQLVNGEIQKTYEQILQEVVISMELCALGHENRGISFANGFVNIQAVKCVKGHYPAHLQKLWEEYDDRKESENDHPQCFMSDQIYVVLEMAFSGKDMEKFIFKNAEQSYYALQQIVFALAVGEMVYEFEHRDLHWGNILIATTNEKYICYKLKNQVISLPTKGVKATVIDYTLSRITYGDCCYYNDLSLDKDLFAATGDYQFDIYRMMRDILNDKWETFEPKTNVFWISYIISKLLNNVKYKNNRTKLHLEYIKKLRTLESTILSYKSCMDFAMNLIMDI